MRKRNRERNWRRRKQPTKRAITLTVEALEPRLVLSAGYGFEGSRDQLDFHHRDDGPRDEHRPAIAEQFHDARGSERLELANRFEFGLPPPGRDGHARGGPPNEPFSPNFFEPVRRGPQLDNQPATPLLYFGGATGESTASTRGIETLPESAETSTVFVPLERPPVTSLPSTSVVFVSLTLATSPTASADLPRLSQPIPRRTPPITSFADSVGQQSSSVVTLPVAVPISLPTLTRIDSTTRSNDSPTIRFDSASSDSEPVWVQRATEPTIVSSKEPANDRISRFSEDSLWAGVSEGGFIEVDTEAADDSSERFEFAEDADDVASFKRLSARTPRDAFWFDFGDARFDLTLDSPAVQDLVEQQASDDTADDDEAWLLDDGGLIVLTTSQCTDPVAEVAAGDDTGESSSTSENTSGEIDIPMDAGLGVFQAIEVAASPVEQQPAVQSVEGTQVPIEGEPTAGTEDAIPTAEQAATNSESGPSEPIRAASMPLLLAFSAFLFRDRQSRKKVADRKRNA